MNTRPSWAQLSPHPLGHPALAERMRAIAESDWRRFAGHRRIIVTATDATGAAEVVTIPEPYVCPACGHVEEIRPIVNDDHPVGSDNSRDVSRER